MIGNADLTVLYNAQSFNPTSYNSSRILNEARLLKFSFLADSPKQYGSALKFTTVIDQTDWIQFGQSTSVTLTDLNLGDLLTSSWTNFPTKYKFIGFSILIDPTVTETSRQIYDTLHMLGDVGGL